MAHKWTTNKTVSRQVSESGLSALSFSPCVTIYCCLGHLTLGCGTYCGNFDNSSLKRHRMRLDALYNRHARLIFKVDAVSSGDRAGPEASRTN